MQANSKRAKKPTVRAVAEQGAKECVRYALEHIRDADNILRRDGDRDDAVANLVEAIMLLGESRGYRNMVLDLIEEGLVE